MPLKTTSIDQAAKQVHYYDGAIALLEQVMENNDYGTPDFDQAEKMRGNCQKLRATWEATLRTLRDLKGLAPWEDEPPATL